MVLGKLPVPERPTIWMIVGQGPIALVIGAGWGCLDIFTLLYPFSPLSPSLWEMHVHAKHYKHNEDGRTAPGVCGDGFVPLSHSGNVVMRIGIHTQDSLWVQLFCFFSVLCFFFCFAL